MNILSEYCVNNLHGLNQQKIIDTGFNNIIKNQLHNC